jgi:hypothetical protein
MSFILVSRGVPKLERIRTPSQHIKFQRNTVPVKEKNEKNKNLKCISGLKRLFCNVYDLYRFKK